MGKELKIVLFLYAEIWKYRLRQSLSGQIYFYENNLENPYHGTGSDNRPDTSLVILYMCLYYFDQNVKC